MSDKFFVTCPQPFHAQRRLAAIFVALFVLAGCKQDAETSEDASEASGFVISGSVAELVSGVITLQLNGKETVTASASQPQFKFKTKIPANSSYSVRIFRQPLLPELSCTLTGGTGVTKDRDLDVVRVTCPKLLSVSLSMTQPMIYPGAGLSLKATGIYTGSISRDITMAGTWQNQTPDILTVTGNQVLGKASGLGKVSFTLGSLTNEIEPLVNNAALTAFNFEMAGELPAGLSTQLKAIAQYDDGTSLDVTNFTAWSTDAPAIASINSGGLLQAYSAGTAVATGRFLSSNISRSIQILNTQLTRLEINPGFLKEIAGIQKGLRLVGHYSNNEFYVIPNQNVTWSTNDPALATISSTGNLVLKSTGKVVISASWGSLLAQLPVSISPKTLSTLTFQSPTANLSLPVGAQVQVKVLASYSDGSIEDVTDRANINATASILKSMNKYHRDLQGYRRLILGQSVGTAILRATYGELSVETSVIVNSAKPTSITVTPTAGVFPRRVTAQMKATAIFDNSSTWEITEGADWSLSDQTRFQINNEVAVKGTLVVGDHGSTGSRSTVTAKLAGITGIISGSTTVSVPNAIASSMGITPIRVLPKEWTQRLSSSIEYSDGSLYDTTHLTTWQTSEPNYAQMSNFNVDRGTIWTIKNTATNPYLGPTSVGITGRYLNQIATQSMTITGTAPNIVRTGNGLRAKYYNTDNLPDADSEDSETPTLWASRIEKNIDYNWSEAATSLGLIDHFSARWSGFLLAPETASYEFCVTSDDGVKVYLGSTAMISAWSQYILATNCTTVSLNAGLAYPIMVEYFENNGPAEISLKWKIGSKEMTVIPKSVLYTTDPTLP